MATPTYTLINQQTLTGTAASITFSNIPQGYSDLVIEVVASKSTTSSTSYLQFNGVTTATYSRTVISGNGTTATSTRSSAATTIVIDTVSTTSTNLGIKLVHLNKYSNASINKTALIRSGTAQSGLEAVIGMWSNTAAITSITFGITAGLFAIGSTFRLYGIAG